MKFKELFRRAPNLSPDALRKYRDEHREDEYTLLDVRQPGEYEGRHLAGAKLIPITELPGRLDEVDRDKPVVTYCAVGGRSRAAAQLLQGQGYKEVYNLEGGIKAWDGETARGPQAWGLEIMDPGDSPAQVLAAAFSLERGLRACYGALAQATSDAELARLYERLAGFEDRHMERLRGAWEELPAPEREGHDLDAQGEAPLMEGGWKVEEFVAEHQGASADRTEAVMLAMGLETQALDLYLRLAQVMRTPQSRELLQELGDEEKSHLKALGQMLEKLQAD
ncbi:rhodanese-like domain-containing protein [Desulfoferula mesophila]|uniref:Sulfurtransferase n=1 Tax=Desulfoferula mesophila TaxID=3058419 RepID=A0AAU9EW50_9BACT|nr:sulfurtransferase [Desulfoferula mesophilus]